MTVRVQRHRDVGVAESFLHHFRGLLIILLASPALAQQQQPDPATYQRVIAQLQRQRNAAMDAAALAEARAALLVEEVAKLKAQIAESEKAK